MPVRKDHARIRRKLAVKKEHAEKTRVTTEHNPAHKSRHHRSFGFNIKKGSSEIHGGAVYSPEHKVINVEYIADKRVGKQGISLEEGHAKFRNKSMDSHMVRDALRKMKKMYPKVEQIVGDRVTGLKATVGPQIFKLKKLAKKIR